MRSDTSKRSSARKEPFTWLIVSRLSGKDRDQVSQQPPPDHLDPSLPGRHYYETRFPFQRSSRHRMETFIVSAVTNHVAGIQMEYLPAKGPRTSKWISRDLHLRP